jgi:predicted nucleotidyltransferase
VLQSKQDIIDSINQIAQRYPLQSVSLFGSMLTEDFSDSSDLDIVVRFNEQIDPIVRGECLLDFQIELEDKFKRQVDVLNQAYVLNPIMKSVVEEAVLIFGDQA